jgi:hypothetical protein
MPHAVTLLTNTCRARERIELSVTTTPAGGNPYRSAERTLDAEVTLPSGRMMRVPGFWFLAHRRNGSVLAPVAGSGSWRVRFRSPESGAHRLQFVRREDGRVIERFDGPSLVLEPPSGDGQIGISAQSPHYLAFESGRPYFAIGQNTCFRSERARQIPVYPDCGQYSPLRSPDLPWDRAYHRWMSRMATNGANWVRLWLRPDFYLEDGEPWQFSQEHAARLDHVLEQAEALGMYVCLCLDDIRDFFHPIAGVTVHNWFSGWNTAWRQLLAAGGHDRTEAFFTAPAAREMMRDKLRYCIARWGYSSHLFAWELWNEIQCVQAPAAAISTWVVEMTQHIRATDPHGHLVKSPYYGVGPELLTRTHGDLNDAHPYFGWHGTEKPRDFAVFVDEFVEPLRRLEQPFLVGEGGLAREVMTPHGLTADLADRDTTCVHVHEALWGALFAGSCGTGMVWWWDDHIDLKNGYWRFRGIANFVRDVPFHNEPFAPGKPTVSDPRLRASELHGETLRLIWVQNRKFNWWDQIHGEKIPAVGGATLTLRDLAPGTYRIEFWNTHSGKIETAATRAVADGSMDLPLPVVTTDLALKLIRQGEVQG